MSTIIRALDGTELIIDSVSQAARTTLYDALGNIVQIADKTTLSSTQKGNIVMGTDGKLGRFLKTDKYGNLNTNKNSLAWYDTVEGAAVNTLIWTQSLTTQTMTQANESILFNASAITTITTGSMIVSTKQFYKKPRVPLLAIFTKVLFNHVNNSVMEMGFGLPASATASTPLTNGAFLRKDTNGSVYLVVSANGTETLSAALTSPNNTSYYTVQVSINDDGASLVVWDSSDVPIIDVSLPLVVTIQQLWTVSHLPIFVRTYNNTAPATAPSLRISTSAVYELDIDDTEPYTHKMVSLGKHLWNSPFTAFAQLANYTNNVAPTTRTPSNTAAGETTLGGHISWNNAGTSFAANDALDLILFGFQNITPYQMCITDLIIDTVNLGAANGATEYTLEYFTAINSTAISLVTATYSRQVKGFQSLAASSPIGARFQPRIEDNLQSPIIVEAGRFFVLGVRVISGSATAAQVIRTVFTPKGYFR